MDSADAPMEQVRPEISASYLAEYVLAEGLKNKSSAFFIGPWRSAFMLSSD